MRANPITYFYWTECLGMRLGSDAQHCWLTLAVASPWLRVSLRSDQRILDCGTGGLRQNEGGGRRMEVG